MSALATGGIFLAASYPGGVTPLPSDPVAPILLTLVFIGFAAALGGYAMRRMGQPAVLGELLVGMLVANVAYLFHQPVLTVLREGPVVQDIVNGALAHGVSLAEAAHRILPSSDSARRVVAVLSGPIGPTAISVYQFVDQLSRIAIIVLLFLVGLETSLTEMKKVGRTSFLVAVVGVICPGVLGFLAMAVLQPRAPAEAHLFIGGILTATSVGITARVFRDLRQVERREARIVLGAAVIDDVLGLVLLAVASGLVARGALSAGAIVAIALEAALFLFGSIGIGLWAAPRLLPRLARYRISNLDLLFGLGLAFGFSWLANRAGLATIVGAFAAGLVLEDFFRRRMGEGPALRELLTPLESLIVPVYFVLLGMQVKFEAFADVRTLLEAAALSVAAILGKLVAGLPCGAGMSRLSVGLGMMPRGEVGLIFASIGRELRVVSDATFSAIVVMVMLTTFLAPPLLKASLVMRKPPASP